jgi:ketosteroid isomerase-like protein
VSAGRARSRPAIDSLEVHAPRLAAAAVRLIARLPAGVRRRALAGAFARAQDAFNRGDLPAVFALFDEQVEYVPPPALHSGSPLRGRDAVVGFWAQTLARFPASTIENLAVEETSPQRFVRTARLTHRHSDGSEGPRYAIRQTTELRDGRVIRQVNEEL